MKRIILITIILLSYISNAHSQHFDYEKIASHPRLLLPKGEENKIKQGIDANSSLQNVHKRIINECDEFLRQPPVERVMEGKRLLAISRIALKRIYYLSYAYRIMDDERYAQRAKEEMLAVCDFQDWNPSHFLDVGEMVMGLAIGYDWLHTYLDEQTKLKICNAILEKGFNEAKDTKNAWFYRRANNWNSVCNSGLVFGALALFDKIPETSKEVIEKAMDTNPIALACYGPDGGYPEGFGYWGYGTSFQVLLSAALESALGTDGGLSYAPGFMQSARFIQYMTAPSGDSFCFYDSPITAESNMMMFWFAKKTNDLSILSLEKKYLEEADTRFAEDRLLPSLIIFASDIDFNEIKAPKDSFWFNKGETPVYIYREGWQNATDTYLGLKGGSPSTSHGHMDAGSFVFEKDGVRWAMDLGMQTYYNLENKGIDLWNMNQDGQRWDVFRLNNMAHNTLTINKGRHLVNSFAPITKIFMSDDLKGGQVNLSSTFANSLKGAIRTIQLDNENNLLISDCISTQEEKDAEVMWVMVTSADAKVIDQRSIELSKNGKKMLLTVDSSITVTMKTWSNEPKIFFDSPNPGTIRIGFETTVPQNTEETFNVQLKTLNN